MAAPKRLRAVSPDDVPVPARSVSEAAASESMRELLVSMRTRIAAAVEDEGTPARDLASLTKRLMEVARDIESIDLRDREDDAGVVSGGEAFDASAV